MATLNAKAVIGIIKEKCEAYGSVAAFAASADCSRQFIYFVLRGDRQPSKRLLAHLGLRRVVRQVVTYERVEDD